SQPERCYIALSPARSRSRAQASLSQLLPRARLNPSPLQDHFSSHSPEKQKPPTDRPTQSRTFVHRQNVPFVLVLAADCITMKTITTLSLLLLLTGAGSADTFWQTFKTAVSKRDVETIARLSKFPIGMSYGIPSIKTKAQLSK